MFPLSTFCLWWLLLITTYNTNKIYRYHLPISDFGPNQSKRGLRYESSSLQSIIVVGEKLFNPFSSSSPNVVYILWSGCGSIIGWDYTSNPLPIRYQCRRSIQYCCGCCCCCSSVGGRAQGRTTACCMWKWLKLCQMSRLYVCTYMQLVWRLSIIISSDTGSKSSFTIILLSIYVCAAIGGACAGVVFVSNHH